MPRPKSRSYRDPLRSFYPCTNVETLANLAGPLLELDVGTHVFELGLHLLSLFLGRSFLHVIRSAIDQIFGLLEAQAGKLTHHLDDLDLFVADTYQDYIKFARAKGLTNRRVVLVHLMKNIMIPVVTVLGLEFGGLIAFSVVTESVFAWPGMGKLIIDSIQSLDRPVIVAYLMIIVLIFVVINLVVDVMYSIVDPRVRLSDVKSCAAKRPP